MSHTRWLLICALVALQACDGETSKSSDISNENIRADFTAVSTETEGSVEISAILSDGEANVLYLTNDDVLFASNGVPIDEALDLDGDLFENSGEVSESVASLEYRDYVEWDLLFTETDPFYPEYYTDFANPDRSQPFYVSFVRSSDDSVYNLEIPLPPAFDFDGVPASVNRTDPIPLTWAPAGSNYDMRLAAAAICVLEEKTVRYTYTKDIVDDPGVVDVTALEIFEGVDPGGVCSLEIAVERVRTEISVEAFGNGCVTKGIEKRVVNFTLE